MTDYKDYIGEVKKITSPRKQKLNKTVTTYDIYKRMRKNKWQGIGKPVSEKDYYAIVSGVNALLAEELLKGKGIKLPFQLGTLELRKLKAFVGLIDGELKTNLPIDWDTTLKLWYEDEEARLDKVLVRSEIPEIFRIYYNRSKANYNNKGFYQFRPVRDLKVLLAKAAKNNSIDAYLLYRKNG